MFGRSSLNQKRCFRSAVNPHKHTRNCTKLVDGAPMVASARPARQSRARREEGKRTIAVEPFTPTATARGMVASARPARQSREGREGEKRTTAIAPFKQRFSVRRSAVRNGKDANLTGEHPGSALDAARAAQREQAAHVPAFAGWSRAGAGKESSVLCRTPRGGDGDGDSVTISAPFNFRHLAHVEADAGAACGFRGLPPGWLWQLLPSLCLAYLVRAAGVLAPLVAAACLDSFCDVAVPVLASSIEHGPPTRAAVVHEAKKSAATTAIKFVLIQAVSLLGCPTRLASMAGRVVSSVAWSQGSRTLDVSISPPSNFHHALHVGSGDAAGIQALLQMAEKREQISSPFNFLHTVHMDTSFRVTHHTLHDQAACGARFRV